MTDFAEEFEDLLKDITVGNFNEDLSSDTSAPSINWNTLHVAKGSLQTQSGSKFNMNEDDYLNVRYRLYLDLEDSSGSTFTLNEDTFVLRGNIKSSQYSSTMELFEVNEFDVLNGYYQWADLEKYVKN